MIKKTQTTKAKTFLINKQTRLDHTLPSEQRLPERSPCLGQNCTGESAKDFPPSMIMMQSQTPVMALCDPVANMQSETPLADKGWLS